MLKVKNKLIFFNIKSDLSKNIYFSINTTKSYIYNMNGLDKKFRHVNNLSEISEEIDILDFESTIKDLTLDFNFALELYENINSSSSNPIVKKKRIYRILDDKDIEFMKTDIYKKNSLIFNLILGIKILEYIDEDKNYYFTRINPLNSVPDYEFVKFPENYVLTKAIFTNCTYEHRIASFCLDILLNEDEKKFVKNYFYRLNQNNTFKIGQLFKKIEIEDVKERNTEYYNKNPKLYEDILGIFVVSYVNQDKILLSKLDYYQYQCPFDFRYEIPIDDFLNMKFELLRSDYYDYIVLVLKTLCLRKHLYFVPKHLL